jgi:pimeloyl-ACP methyl ester carboxylesterase
MAVTIIAREVLETRDGDMPLAKSGRGERPMVVVTPMAEWMTAALPAELCDLFTLNLLELPGAGDAAHPAGASSVGDIGAAVTDVAERLGPATVLFGHSMNGALALAAAATATCAGVIAVTPPATLPPDPAVPGAYWESHAEPARRHRAGQVVAAYEATSDEQERARLQGEFTRLHRWYDLDFDSTELDSLAVLNQAWISSVFDSGKAMDWQNTFRQLKQPVLLALGDYDFVAPPVAWTTENVPPSATVHHFAKSSHTPYLEESEAFIQVMQDWMANIS